MTATLTDLADGTTYSLIVRAVNDNGSGTASTSTNLTPSSAAVPGAPYNLTTMAGDGQGTLTFTTPAPVVGHPVTSYQASTDAGATWTELTGATASGSTITANLSGLTDGTTYSVTVRALNSNGSGAASTPAALTPSSTEVPAAPTNLSATPGDGQASLSFTAPAAVVGHPVTSYEASIDGGASWITLTASTSGSTVTATLSPLTNETTYSVVVRAVNDNGTGGATTTATVTPTSSAAPSAPTNLAAAPGDTQGTLTFTAPTAIPGHPVTGYEVSTDGGTTWSPLSTSGSGSSLTATLTGLTNGATYPVTVRAVNDNGSGTAAAGTNLTPSSSAVPAAPTNLAGAPGSGLGTLTFTAPAVVPGHPVTRYQASADGGASWTTLTTRSSGTGVTATLAGLTNGTTYSVIVRASNDNGDGTASTPTNLTPSSVAVPGAPTNLTAAPGDTEATLVFVAPATVPGHPTASYEASTDGGTTWTAIDSSTSGATVTGTLSGLTDDTTYPVVVRAVNDNGHGTASTGTTVRPTSSATTAAPTNLATTPGDGQGTVTFTAPAAVPGHPTTSYQVSTDGGTSWTTVATTTSGSTVSATVTELANGTTYPVRVRAVNDNGASAGSSPANLTPQAAPPVAGRPAAVAGPTARPSKATVWVSWAQSPEPGVTGYTVTASPGPATCTTSSVSATTCLLGATTGLPYTYTVVAHSPQGDSSPSAPTATAVAGMPDVPAATPTTAPRTLTTTEGMLTSVTPQQPVTLLGKGFEPYSTVAIIAYPGGTVLDTVEADSTGLLTGPIAVPAFKRGQPATFVLSGTDTAGNPALEQLSVTVTSVPTPAVKAPAHVTVTPKGGDLTVSFDKVTPVGARVTDYQVSLDGGTTWRTVRTTGAARLSTAMGNVTAGRAYRVRVRALATADSLAITGLASATVSVTVLDNWFHDPVSPKNRRAELAVPAHPGSYAGALRATIALFRSHNGTIAVPAAWTKGHHLAAHEAATLVGDGLFGFDSAHITAAGTAQIRLLAASLKGDKAATCEGYTDYAGSAAHEAELSRARAVAVCAALHKLGVKASLRAVGYGGARPAVVGGTPRSRVDNRRVVVYVSR